MKRWSKLQKELYDIVSSDIKFQIHCVSYPMKSKGGTTNLPRYWITLDKEVIWDYPKDFKNSAKATNTFETNDSSYNLDVEYPYANDVSAISDLIREYIDAPKETIIENTFENDKWSLTEIFKAADRRVGARRFDELFEIVKSEAGRKILLARKSKKGIKGIS